MSDVLGVLGVGIDLVDVDRVAGLLARKPKAEARLFTEQERAYCRRFSAAAERFAARVAAKEAVGKALGIGVIGWREIEILSGGKPRVRLMGKTGLIARELGVQRVELSLTHTAGQAAAVAVAVGDGPGPGEAAGRGMPDRGVRDRGMAERDLFERGVPDPGGEAAGSAEGGSS